MRILFIVPYVPNLIRVRPYNFIKHLAERGHSITLLTTWSEEGEQESLKAVQEYCQAVIALRQPLWRSLLNSLSALPTRQPLQAVFAWNRQLARSAEQLALDSNGRSAFDVVHVEHLRGARYGLALKRSLQAHGYPLPVVWDSVDSISLLFRQAMMRSKSLFGRGITRLDLKRTERYEGWLVRQFECVLVTSPTDQRVLNHLAGNADTPIIVLPNGVDLNYFQPAAREIRERETIVLSGKMSYHANVTMVLHFLEEILPRIWKQRPTARVIIVGKDPPTKITAWRSDRRVEVTGTVSDICPYLSRATLAACPIAYGVGIQNKVLEAMACGTPVIASSQAVSALQAEPGEHLLVADNADDFAREILNLLEDDIRRERLGLAGRRYVEQHHDWGLIAANLEEIYMEAIEVLRSGSKMEWKKEMRC